MEFFLSVLLPSLALITLWAKFFLKDIKGINLSEISLVCLGIGPSLNTWILNILLLFFPKLPHFIYIVFPTLIYVVFSSIYHTELREFLSQSVASASNFLASSINKILIITTSLFLTLFSLYQLYAINKFVITGSDQIIYAQQGKIIARDASIKYKRDYFDDKTKFYYLALHGFSYPLFSTINYLYNYSFGFKGDLFFVNISNYYLILIALLVLVELQKFLPFKYKHYSFLSTLFFLTSPLVIVLSYIRSIDSYRVFLLISSLIIFNEYLVTKKLKLLYILGLFIGLASNSHIIGLVLSCIFIAAIFFQEGLYKEKIKNTFIVITVATLFGAYHYPIQTFYGDGWVFRKSYSVIKVNPVQNTISDINAQKKNSKQQNFVTGVKKDEVVNITKVQLEKRELTTKLLLIKNGLLGIFLRFDQFGIINMVLPILLVLFVREVFYSKRNLFILFVSMYFFLMISVYGYANYRYQFTLHPFIIFFVALLFFHYANKKTLKIYLVRTVAVIFFILTVLNTTFTLKEDLLSYIRKYSSKHVETGENKKMIDNTSDIIKSKGSSDIITYIKNLEIPYGDAILTSGTRMLNYYTDTPAYFFNSVGQIYEQKGKVPICRDNSTAATLNSLKNDYHISHIVIRTTDINSLGCLRTVIDSHSTIVFNSGTYKVYKINYFD
jgi:hypothetical protein